MLCIWILTVVSNNMIWCYWALRTKNIWIISASYGNLEYVFTSPFREFYLFWVIYWHIYPLESTGSPLACFFSWNWTSRISIRPVEGDGMARERSIYRFQVFHPFLQFSKPFIWYIYLECVIICSVGLTGVVVLYLWRIYCISLGTIQWVQITWPNCLLFLFTWPNSTFL